MTSYEFDIEKIFLILRSHAWLIISILLAAIAISAAITHQMPRMYKATTKLNFEFGANYPLENGRSTAMLVQDTYLTTQVGILKSQSLAQKVVDEFTDYEADRFLTALRAANSPLKLWMDRTKGSIKSLFTFGGSQKEKKSSGGGNIGTNGVTKESLSVRRPYHWMAGAISSGVSVAPVFNTRLVEITYTSTDPEIATLIAERVAEAYITSNLQMMVDPAQKSKVWFDEQLKVLRIRLEEAQVNLTTFEQTEGIVSTGERIDMESSRLHSLANQLIQAQQGTRDAETGKQKLEEVRRKGDSLMTFEPVFNNPVVQRIRADLRGLEGQLVEASNTLGANHPTIKQLKSELAATRQRLSAEIQTITDGIDNATALSKERELDLEQEMKKQKELVLELKNEHDRIAILKREVDSAQATYNAALNQLNTTSMQSMVDQPNVSIVDHAGIPRTPDSPKVTKNLVIGAFGGLLLGVGLAVFLSVFVRRVHSKEDLISEVGVPLLLGHLKKA